MKTKVTQYQYDKSVADDARTYRCPECHGMFVRYDNRRYEPCPNKKCRELGVDASWVDNIASEVE